MEKLKDYFKNFKLNGYLIAELFFAFTISRFGKVSNKIFGGFLLVFALIWAFTALTGKSVVRNFSKRKVFVKCENDDTVFEVEHSKSKSFIDGIKVDEKVYKISDGLSIWVFDNFVFYPSITGVLYHLLGRDKLNEAPDEGWQPLFEK